MHSKIFSRKSNKEKSLDKARRKLKSPYTLYRIRKKTPENSLIRYKKGKENSNAIGSYAGFESIISTRDHSSKRSNTPIIQYIHNRRVNSFSIRANNQNESNVSSGNNIYNLKNSLQGYSDKIHTKKNKTVNENNIKKIGKIMETYGHERPRSSFYTQRQSSLKNENKANIENIANFFQAFHEKSKVLLSQFEKTVNENKNKIAW